MEGTAHRQRFGDDTPTMPCRNATRCASHVEYSKLALIIRQPCNPCNPCPIRTGAVCAASGERRAETVAGSCWQAQHQGGGRRRRLLVLHVSCCAVLHCARLVLCCAVYTVHVLFFDRCSHHLNRSRTASNHPSTREQIIGYLNHASAAGSARSFGSSSSSSSGAIPFVGGVA